MEAILEFEERSERAEGERKETKKKNWMRNHCSQFDCKKMEEADAALALALQLEEEEAARQEQQAAALAAAQSRADEVAQNLTYGLTLAAKVKRGKRRRCGKKKGKRCLFNLLLLLRPPLSLSLSHLVFSSTHSKPQHLSPASLAAARAVTPLERLRREAKQAVVEEEEEKKKNDDDDNGKSEEERKKKKAKGLTETRALLDKLLSWFKHDFFEWIDSPKCERCDLVVEEPACSSGSSGSREKTRRYKEKKDRSEKKCIGATPPTPLELSLGCGRVELWSCSQCGSDSLRFPRHNDVPTLLLETRGGRCGEFANAFTVVCNVAGLVARLVLDFSDHVWWVTLGFSFQLGERDRETRARESEGEVKKGTGEGGRERERDRERERERQRERASKKKKLVLFSSFPPSIPLPPPLPPRTEVFDPEQKRWLHADSCEAIADEPLLYEVGWSKKPARAVLAFSARPGDARAADVTLRYTRLRGSELEENRRSGGGGQGLTGEALRAAVEKAGVVPFEGGASAAAAAAAERRAADERELSSRERNDAASSLPARTAGDAAWIRARGEDGKRRGGREEEERQAPPPSCSSSPSVAEEGKEENDFAYKIRREFERLRVEDPGLAPNEAAVRALQRVTEDAAKAK